MAAGKVGEAELARKLWLTRLATWERQLVTHKNERTHIGLGRIYAALGDKVRALERVRLALDTNPGDPWSLLYAADIYAQLGDRGNALEAFRHAVDRGFLALHYADRHFASRTDGLYRYRNEPEFRDLRDRLARKVTLLRTQY